MKRYSHTHNKNNVFSPSPVTCHLLALSADTESQHLLSWSPKEWWSGQTSIPHMDSWDKNHELISEFKVEDKSRSFYNYGGWEFNTSSFTSKKVCNTTATIDVVNIRGDLFIQSSSTFKIGLGSLKSARKNIYQNDRSD